MEIWKDIPGYENYYQVSNLGNVKSLDRIVKHYHGFAKLKSQELKQTKNNKGYLYVSLYKDCKGKKYCTHQLVAMAFLNHIPKGYINVIDHKDENQLNNKLANLRIMTHRKNVTRGKTNKTGYIGVYKSGRGYKSLIRIKGKRYHLGTFDTAEEAYTAYLNALNSVKPLT